VAARKIWPPLVETARIAESTALMFRYVPARDVPTLLHQRTSTDDKSTAPERRATMATWTALANVS